MAGSRRLTVINVPSDLGSMIKGKSLAPRAFKELKLVDQLSKAGYTVSEEEALPNGPATWQYGASFGPNGVRNEQANVEVNTQVKRAVSSATSNSTDGNPPFLFIVGGGCDMVPAVMSGLWKTLSPKRVGLLYVDGDADLSVPGEPGGSGNLASMTFTHLTMVPGALESMRPFTRPDGSGVVDPSNAVIFGLNAALQGNTRSQMGYLMDEGYRVFTSAAVAKEPKKRAEQALEYLEERVDRILVHLDVDAIDATSFPLANVANRTGAGFDEILSAMDVFLESDKVCGLVVAEVNPDHDPGLEMTNQLIQRLVDALSRRK
jgi:arginase